MTYSSNPNNYQTPTPAPASKEAPVYGQPATGVPATYGQGPIDQFHSTGPPQWSTGLCDCLDDPATFCITCWCPCITFGKIAEIVDKGTTSCITAGTLYTLIYAISGLGCIYSCCYRTKMRHQYMLPEQPCHDFLIHLCCEVCALCQEYRELQHHGFDMSVGWEENMMRRESRGVVMPPVVPEGMSR
ncbi:hypothetical protein LguiB_025241 [Lonicera macranthoides]